MKNLSKYWPLIIILILAVILFYQGKKNGYTLNSK